MSLIKCPECGKENVSDSAEACPRCGFGIKKYYENKTNKVCVGKEQEGERSVQQEKIKKIGKARYWLKKKKNGMSKSKIAISIIIILVVSFFMILSVHINGKITYQYAIGKYKLGNYVSAENSFSKLGDYRDSKDYLYKCSEKIAQKLFERKKYEEAQKKFESIENYDDKKNYIKQCDMEMALKFYKEKKYEAAKEKFIKLDGYGKSSQYIYKCRAFLAEQMYNQKKYEKAYDNLVDLGCKNYKKIIGKDSKAYKKMLNKCLNAVKDKAHNCFEQGKYTDALDAYNFYYSYKDKERHIDDTSGGLSYDLACAEYNFMMEYKKIKANWYYYSDNADYCQGYINIDDGTIYVSGVNDIKVQEGIYSYNVKTECKKILGKKYYICYLYVPEINMKIENTIEYNDITELVVSIYKEKFYFKSEKYYLSNDKERRYLEKPYVGMTEKQVESSSWGKPDDINKTTYEWGNTQQWCYPNNKYIYFENGVVTSISE